MANERMSDEDLSKLTPEQRLKATLFQYSKLYARWSEDREVFNESMAEQEKALKDFTQKISQFESQIDVFENLESQVRQKIINSIHSAAVDVGKTIGEEARKASLSATKSIVHELSQSVYGAQSVLRDYQTEVITTQWKVIGIGAIVTVLTCFLIFKLLMPSPVLPLSDKQIEYLRSGEMMELVWPKLSKKDKEHWEKLADKINHPDQDANHSSNSNE